MTLKPFLIGICFLLITLNLAAQSDIPNHGLLFKAGYGGTYTYSGTTLTGIKDNLRFGIDFIHSRSFAVALNYDKPFLYNYFNLQELSLIGKYFPFDWYNQPFIGFGYTYGTYKFGNDKKYLSPLNGKEGLHSGFCLNWGLNIQFPKNIYIIFDVTNVFSGYTGILNTNTQTMQVNGLLGYRLDFKSNQ